MFRFDGTGWVEEAKLTASDRADRDHFGLSVSVSGDTVVVAASQTACADGLYCGAASVYRFNGTGWVEEAKLTASDEARGDRFGVSVSVSGNTVVVGSRQSTTSSANCNTGHGCGAVYAYHFNGTGWVEEAKLTASDGRTANRFGTSVSVSGDSAVVGAWGDVCVAGTNCGAAYVFDCTPKCGNGILDPGEACDDGGESATCDVDCTAPECGDGTPNITTGEECETGGESATCDANCTLALCGDGTLNVTAGEECDGMDDSACPGVCLSDCTCGPFCDNGVCDPGENSCTCPNDCGTPPPSETPGSTCRDGLDNDCDGFIDLDDPDCADEPIPAVSQWGMIVTALLLLAAGKIVFRTTARPMPKP